MNYDVSKSVFVEISNWTVSFFRKEFGQLQFNNTRLQSACVYKSVRIKNPSACESEKELSTLSTPNNLEYNTNIYQ